MSEKPERTAQCLETYAARFDNLHRDIADDFRAGAKALRALGRIADVKPGMSARAAYMRAIARKALEQP